MKSEDGLKRCWWCGNDPLYVDYHDQEWGMPVVEDQKLFEKPRDRLSSPLWTGEEAAP